MVCNAGLYSWIQLPNQQGKVLTLLVALPLDLECFIPQSSTGRNRISGVTSGSIEDWCANQPTHSDEDVAGAPYGDYAHHQFSFGPIDEIPDTLSGWAPKSADSLLYNSTNPLESSERYFGQPVELFTPDSETLAILASLSVKDPAFDAFPITNGPAFDASPVTNAPAFDALNPSRNDTFIASESHMLNEQSKLSGKSSISTTAATALSSSPPDGVDKEFWNSDWLEMFTVKEEDLVSGTDKTERDPGNVSFPCGSCSQVFDKQWKLG